MHRYARTTFLAVLSLFAIAAAARPQQPQPGELPWFIQLGQRVARVRDRMPFENRVVLVPDEATFLQEIALWRAGRSALDKDPATRDRKLGCWPVLIEDDVFTPMFLRAYKPARVIRRLEKAPPLTDADSVREAVRKAIFSCWFADADSTGGDRAIFAREDHTPPGMVAYSAKDPAYVAAAALGAAEGLIPVEIDGEFGTPNGAMDQNQFNQLAEAIRSAFAGSGMEYRRLGDELDTLALCIATAQRAVLDLPPAQQPAAPGMPPIKPGEPVAVTDALCRNDDGSRFAVCGAIFGSSARAAYMAMCSVFLQRNMLWCVDSYTAAPQLGSYGFSPIVPVLQETGLTHQVLQGPDAELAAWRSRMMTGWNCDMLFLNSSGNADFFDLCPPTGAMNPNRGGPGDIPVLDRPLALSMIHSWSLLASDERETIGGRWLDSGVYAYVGSVHEPYLFAFVPPAMQLERLVNLTPFLVAARQFDGPFAVPWRVDTLGDPLMVCSVPRSWNPPDRIDPTPMLPGYEDALIRCTERLRACKDDADGAASMAAMRDLARLDRDDVAVKLWQICSDKAWSARVAPFALDPLFARRERQAFLVAYGRTAAPTDRQRDMLWQLWGPQLDQLKDPQQVELFANAVRKSWPSMDWQRLRGPMTSAVGLQATRAAMLRAVESTRNEQHRAAMQALLAK